jgi:hypothetical protein
VEDVTVEVAKAVDDDREVDTAICYQLEYTRRTIGSYRLS